MAKQVQIIIRTTQEEKAIINIKVSKDKGISVNEFIKRIILEDYSIKEDINDNISDNKIHH